MIMKMMLLILGVLAIIGLISGIKIVPQQEKLGESCLLKGLLVSLIVS